MGLPKISVIFKNIGATAVQRGAKGIVALVLEDVAAQKGQFTLTSVTDIPSGLSAENKSLLNLVFIGGDKAPFRVELYVTDKASPDYTAALTYFETIKFDYIALPAINDATKITVTAWVKGQRDSGHYVKAVLAKCAADYEGIINFATDNIKTKVATYSAAQYSVRIAGLLAGNAINTACTYQVLPEVIDVPHLTKSAADALVDAGQLILYFDGKKVKCARGVNSLVSITGDKSESWKKIIVVDKMDLIAEDLIATAEDSYIGKVINNYDHKCLLVSAMNGYLQELAADEIVEKSSVAEIDVLSQKNYLISTGVDVTKMTDMQIKQAKTADKVFISATVGITDAMEDITINVLS